MSLFGKIVGGTLGFALGGPLGAIMGAALGHAFDSDQQYYTDSRQPRLSVDEEAQLTFFVAAFSMLAKLVKADGRVLKEEIDTETIEKSKCIVGRFEITPHDFEKSWTSLFIWMNENGYKKAEENPFEIYHNDFREHAKNKCIVDFHIPIE